MGLSMSHIGGSFHYAYGTYKFIASTKCSLMQVDWHQCATNDLFSIIIQIATWNLKYWTSSVIQLVIWLTWHFTRTEIIRNLQGGCFVTVTIFLQVPNNIRHWSDLISKAIKVPFLPYWATSQPSGFIIQCIHYSIIQLVSSFSVFQTSYPGTSNSLCHQLHCTFICFG